MADGGMNSTDSEEGSVAELISQGGVYCMELFRYLVDFWRAVMRSNMQW
jgi:hypothetical protein